MNLFFLLYFVAGIVAGLLGCLLFNRIKNRTGNQAAEEEIISIVNESTEKGMIEETEAEMINNIFEFGDKAAKDIMTDRSNIIAIDSGCKLEDAIEIMLDGSNSRFPVFDENIDHIVGILHLKDAISFNRDKNNRKKTVDSIEGLFREAKFIPETTKIDSLFAMMRTYKYQMVIVIDEYGQTSGVVAMRDILEEIVGDIDDEYDVTNDFIVAKEDSKYVIEGLSELHDLENILGIEFEEDNFETINGFLISKMEHIPDKKEKFEYEYKGYLFKVLSVENKMIKQVLVCKIDNNDIKQDILEEDISEK